MENPSKLEDHREATSTMDPAPEGEEVAGSPWEGGVPREDECVVDRLISDLDIQSSARGAQEAALAHANVHEGDGGAAHGVESTHTADAPSVEQGQEGSDKRGFIEGNSREIEIITDMKQARVIAKEYKEKMQPRIPNKNYLTGKCFSTVCSF